MKQKSKSSQSSGNKKYIIGSHQTAIGPSGNVVWLFDVSEIDTKKTHMIGIHRYNDETLWVRDTDKEAQQLIKDRDRMISEIKREQAQYAEYLREQKHGGR